MIKMVSSIEALMNSWDWKEPGYWSQTIGEVEVCLEPLIFEGQFYLAVYKDGNLVGDKVCIKLGKEPEE